MRTRHFVAMAALGVVTVFVAASVAWAAPSHRQVVMLDACDGPSFNAAIGEGTCTRPGGVTFDHFVAQLVQRGEAPAWRFAPTEANLAPGGTISAPNKGGEFHTFTEVADFGGGCVPELNELLGLTPVPECQTPGIIGATGAPPGGVVTTGPISEGTHQFMCLIHPWMQATVTVG
jgi:plastocyanin